MDNPTSTTIFEPLTSLPPAKARIGLILLHSDEIGEDAFTCIMPENEITVFTTRTGYDHSGGGFTLPTSFKAVTDTLPPAGRFDVLAFSCTSGTVALGANDLLSELQQARPGIKYTSPGVAGVAALQQLNAKNVALLTPYVIELHQKFLPFLRENGFDVVADGTFNINIDSDICDLRTELIFSGAKTLVERSSPDALFVSCTSTPIVPHIDHLERALGIPVVTSSQAMAWDALRLAGYHKPVDGFGRLLSASR
ncbi:hypothetical protein [Mesorhizobium sp. M0590]|uniref:maleate cis-trans isomerase family protein n=1 Tax=Mesorhizobium sp. M0590 TaxID=2956966 RepID=UPI003339E371